MIKKVILEPTDIAQGITIALFEHGYAMGITICNIDSKNNHTFEYSNIKDIENIELLPLLNGFSDAIFKCIESNANIKPIIVKTINNFLESITDKNNKTVVDNIRNQINK